MGINVISLFDGISCARVALNRIGIKVDSYKAAEIDKYAIQISKKNWPEIEHVGSVVGLHVKDKIDLLIGGSPCQDLSIAKNNRKGLQGERSSLFYEYVRILEETKPAYFVLENVASMSKESKDTISKILGVEPIMINASLVSAQNRKRLFWTNIKDVCQPEDRNIYLNDILEDANSERLKSLCIDASYYKGSTWNHYQEKHVRQMVRIGSLNSGGQGDRIYSTEGKSVSLSANGGGRGAKTGLYKTEHGVRKLSPIECERLQGLPDNYTEGISDTQRYKCLGNAFNVDVVAHILSYMFVPDCDYIKAED